MTQSKYTCNYSSGDFPWKILAIAYMNMQAYTGEN